MKLPNIVGICGQAGAGKDTAARWFLERGYARSAFADPLKFMLNQAFGFSPADWEDRRWKEGYALRVERADGGILYTSPRELAQWLGTDVVRNNFGDDAWVNLWKQRWHDTGQPRVVVPDVRFQNEVDAIHKLGGVVLRIVRKGDRSAEAFFSDDGDPVLTPHESEQTNKLRSIDHEITNDGTIQDLHDKIAWYAGENQFEQA